MRRTLAAVVFFGALELASLSAVLAIAQAATTVHLAPTASVRDCVQYVISGYPVVRCGGG